MIMNETASIEFGVREIKELEFFVDESKEIDGTYDFNYHVDMLPDVGSETIRIIITANYLNSISKMPFLKGKISTSFYVKNLQSFSRKLTDGKDTFDIAEDVWVTFFSIAFTHARALLGKSSAGTKFMGLLMTVINPQQEFKKLFGKYLAPKNDI
jgi:hypothetical protein